MIIKSLRAKNFLIFEDTGQLDLSYINLIYGPNSSGKSVIKLILETFVQPIKNGDSKDYFFVGKIPTPENGQGSGTTFIFNLEAKSSMAGLLHPLGVSDTDPDTDISIEISLFFIPKEQKSKLEKLDIRVSEISGEQVVSEKSLFRAECINENNWSFLSDFLDTISSNEQWEKITLTSGFIPSIGTRIQSETIWDVISETGESEASTRVGDNKNNSLAGAKEEIEYLYKFLDRLSNEVLKLFEAVRFISPLDRISSKENVQLEKINKSDIAKEIFVFFSQHPLLSHDLINTLERTPVTYSGSWALAYLLQGSTDLQTDDLAAIEHPEALLDNQAQLSLMDYLAKKAIDQEIRLIIETHSEMMLLRLLKRLKQSTRKRLPREFPKKIKKEDISIWVVRKNELEKFEIIKMLLNDNGELLTPWPNGFFEEGFVERFS